MLNQRKNPQPLDATTDLSENRQQISEQIWKLRWFFVVVVTLWLALALALTFLVFFITQSLYSFALFGTLGPPFALFYCIAKFLFRDEKDVEMARLKWQKTAHKENISASHDS